MIRKFVFNTLVRVTAAVIVAGGTVGAHVATTLLNVSYDPTRKLYKEVSTEFAKKWKAEVGEDITPRASHGGSGRQARSVIDGLDADVVTLALGHDIDAIAEKSLTGEDWQKRPPCSAPPYTSAIVFLVHKGNLKGIKDWNDLIKLGIVVITPNLKTSGGVCQNYLAAWAYALEQPDGSDAIAKDFVQKLYKNVPVLDLSVCGVTITFIERGIGDVLIAWEDEALLTARVEGKDKFDVVVPSVSILAESSVAVVDEVADKKSTRKAAEAYLESLYTPQGQEIGAKNFYRPTDPAVAKKYESELPKVRLVTIGDTFGGQQEAQKTHFADGGQFDQLHQPDK